MERSLRIIPFHFFLLFWFQLIQVILEQNAKKSGEIKHGPISQAQLDQTTVFLVLMMMVILLVSFIITNQIAKRIVERKVTDSVDKILLQAEEKMTSFYTDMSGISISLLYSPTIQTALTVDKLTMILMNPEVTSMFANTMSLKENIRGIQLYNNEGAMLATTGKGIGDSAKLPFQYYQYKIETSNDNVNWTLQADKTNNTNTDQIQNDVFYDDPETVRSRHHHAKLDRPLPIPRSLSRRTGG